MSDRPDADFEECPQCKARFPIERVKLPDSTESSDEVEDVGDMNTQFGWLSGQCPACGADLRLAYDRVRNRFLPPN